MERRSPTGIDRREAVETPQTCQSRSAEMERGGSPQTRQSRSAEMERRSPTGIDRREAVETPHRVGMKRRSPTGIDGREGDRNPEHKRGNGAPVSDRHRPPRGGRNPPNPPEQARKWSAGLRPASTAERRSKPPKPAGLRPIDQPAREWSAGLRPASTAERRSKPPKPARAEARKWSAGLRPASRPERAAKPRYPNPSDEADDHGQSCARSQRPAFTGLFRM